MVVLVCINVGLEIANFFVDAGTDAIVSETHADRKNQCGKGDPLTPNACEYVQQTDKSPYNNAMEKVKGGSGMGGTISGESKPDAGKVARDLLRAGKKL